MAEVVQTTCPYCGVGCGVLATPGEGYQVSVKGDPEHPSNFGRLCSKGAALGETVDLDGRLLYPELRGRQVGWDEALDAVSDGLRRVIDQHGPDAVAFYVSGQLLTEDYYLANKLMKGFIGSANIDTNSRLCMSSSVVGHKRAFGSDTVPGCYEDLELADLVVLVGSNAAWCHPVLFQRIRAAKEQRPGLTVIVIDPRRTQSCDIADLHLALKPGSDVALFNGLLHHLVAQGGIDYAFLEQYTEGYGAAFASARQGAGSLPAVALSTGLSEEDIANFYQMFTRTEKVVTVYSQGVNQSSSGSDKVNSIINCHLATGRIGKPGMGPLSFTGQPNAMGGREVGGLANQLAAHMDFDQASIERVSRFWGAPQIARQPGLKAVDLFNAVESGQIKAVWVMATNPVVSMPDADRVRAALAKCELVIVSDVVRHTDTTRHADVLLPALGWGEKDGTVTNSERRISRQRALLPAPGEAKPDWWIIAQVAQRLGYAQAFDYSHVSQIFAEHAALSGFENDGSRDFDLSGLCDLSQQQYDQFAPIQWPVRNGDTTGTARMMGDGRFFTPSGRARFHPVALKLPALATNEAYPLVLNTGRVRDHWHTMTRTGKSQRLGAHISEPYLEVHPRDALRFGLIDGGLSRISSQYGQMLARVQYSDQQQRGSVFIPIHWSDQFSSSGRVDALVNPATDPESGQPELKYTPVHVRPHVTRWSGFLVSASEARLHSLDYWVKARSKQCWNYDLAGSDAPEDWEAWLAEVLTLSADEVEWSQYRDSATGVYRCAAMSDGRLLAYLNVSPGQTAPVRDWLLPLFRQTELTSVDRLSLLFGRPAQAGQNTGRVVCSCFGVGEETLSNAIREQGLDSVLAIGKALKAGTNCGSCVPEIKALLQRCGR